MRLEHGWWIWMPLRFGVCCWSLTYPTMCMNLKRWLVKNLNVKSWKRRSFAGLRYCLSVGIHRYRAFSQYGDEVKFEVEASWSWFDTDQHAAIHDQGDCRSCRWDEDHAVWRRWESSASVLNLCWFDHPGLSMPFFKDLVVSNMWRRQMMKRFKLFFSSVGQKGSSQLLKVPMRLQKRSNALQNWIKDKIIIINVSGRGDKGRSCHRRLSRSESQNKKHSICKHRIKQ